MIIVAFGAVSDIWNVSIYIHIMDKIDLTLVLQKKWKVELLISEITETVLAYPVLHKNVMLIFITSPIFRISWYLLHRHSQIKPQEIIGHIISTL